MDTLIKTLEGIEGKAGKRYWLFVMVKQGLSSSVAGKIILTLGL